MRIIRLLFCLFFLSTLSLKAQINVDSLEKLITSPKELTPEDQISIYTNLSRYYAFEVPTKSLKYAQELHKLGEVTQDLSVQAEALRKMGVAYENLQDFENALSNFIGSITLFEQLEDETKIGLVYNDIAELYLIDGDIEDSEAYYDKCIEIFRKEDHPRNLVRALMGLAYLYNEKDMYDESRVLYHEALGYVLAANKRNMACSIYSNLALTYLDEKDKAKTYQLMDSAIMFSDGNIASLIQAEFYQAYGGAMIIFEDYENSLVMLKRSQNAVEGGLVGDFLLRNMKAQAKCYKNLGKLDSAYHLLEDYISISDSIFDGKSEENYKRFQALFKTQQKENEILAYQEKEQASTYKLILLVALIVILMLASSIIYVSYKRKVERLNYQINQRDSKLTGFALNIIEKNKILKNVRQQLKSNNRLDDMDNLNEIPSIVLSQNPELDEKIMQLEQSFLFDLSSKYPTLTDREKKVCSLLKLNFSSKEIAELLNVSPASVDTYRYRIRKKMELNTNDSLTKALDNI